MFIVERKLKNKNAIKHTKYFSISQNWLYSLGREDFSFSVKTSLCWRAYNYICNDLACPNIVTVSESVAFSFLWEDYYKFQNILDHEMNSLDEEMHFIISFVYMDVFI